MKRLLMLIPLVLLCCLGCQQSQKVAAVDNAEDIQAIRDQIAELNAAVNAADLNRLISIYGDEAVRIPPSEPPSVGKEAIQKKCPTNVP